MLSFATLQMLNYDSYGLGRMGCRLFHYKNLNLTNFADKFRSCRDKSYAMKNCFQQQGKPYRNA